MSNTKRNSKAKRASSLLLAAVVLAAFIILTIVLVKAMTRGSGAPKPTEAPTAAPTAEPTPQPTEDLTMGGLYTLEGEDETLGENDIMYKNTEANIHIYKTVMENADIWIADVRVRDASSIKNCFAHDELKLGVVEKPSAMAQRVNAIFAVNADYAAYRKTGVIIRDSQTLRNEPKQDVLCLYKDGTMRTLSAEQATGENIDSVLHAWSFGPALLNEDGSAKSSFGAYDDIADIIESKNPRTGVGMVEANHFIFAVVDAPQRSSGLTLAQFSNVFSALGCKVAYNMDGGSSSVMLYKGKALNTTKGEAGLTEPRSVSEIIYIG